MNTAPKLINHLPSSLKGWDVNVSELLNVVVGGINRIGSSIANNQNRYYQGSYTLPRIETPTRTGISLTTGLFALGAVGIAILFIKRRTSTQAVNKKRKAYNGR